MKKNQSIFKKNINLIHPVILILILCGFCLLLFVCGDSDTTLTDRKIAFIRDLNFRHQIFLMNSDGSNQEQLFDHYVSVDFPAWSPDGTEIFLVDAKDGKKIFTNEKENKNTNAHFR
ncbi:MAG: hypothetical protein JXJ22_03320 [Bacteroidales bacterium]|nr:hypothetical protein [Bacteroidales bacterium]